MSASLSVGVAAEAIAVIARGDIDVVMPVERVRRGHRRESLLLNCESQLSQNIHIAC